MTKEFVILITAEIFDFLPFFKDFWDLLKILKVHGPNRLFDLLQCARIPLNNFEKQLARRHVGQRKPKKMKIVFGSRKVLPSPARGAV